MSERSKPVVSPTDSVPRVSLPYWWSDALARVMEKIPKARDDNDLKKIMAEHGALGKRLSDELQRQRDAASFVPGPGLSLDGDDALQAEFLAMVRREMARSPSFHKLMMRVNAEPNEKYKVTVHLSEKSEHAFDNFRGGGEQDIDMGDVRLLPVNPLLGYPSSSTQGELLAHAMAEARAGTEWQSADVYQKAHAEGIVAGNAFRRDLGQPGERPAPPGDVVTNVAGARFPYTNGYSEVFYPAEDGRIKEIRRINPPGQPSIEYR